MLWTTSLPSPHISCFSVAVCPGLAVGKSLCVCINLFLWATYRITTAASEPDMALLPSLLWHCSRGSTAREDPHATYPAPSYTKKISSAVSAWHRLSNKRLLSASQQGTSQPHVDTYHMSLLPCHLTRAMSHLLLPCDTFEGWWATVSSLAPCLQWEGRSWRGRGLASTIITLKICSSVPEGLGRDLPALWAGTALQSPPQLTFLLVMARGGRGEVQVDLKGLGEVK